ncbi:MAG: phage tail tape measure protein, partial [Bacteroidota bacterium]
ETKRITDTYAAAITSSQLTMERLTEAMKYAGTTGSALGWSIEETTAAVAQFADLGLEGSMAGTNVRMSMIQLTKATNKAQEALLEMGLTFEDINPETHTFGEIIETLGKQTLSTEHAIAIFGSRSGLNVKKLADSAAKGTSDFAGFVEMLKNSQEGVGRTSEMYNRMMDTFHGQWKIMTSALQDLNIEFFEQFKIVGKGIFQEITKVFNTASQSIADNSIQWQTAFKSVAVTFVSSVKLMIEAIGGLVLAWDSFMIGINKGREIFATAMSGYSELFKKARIGMLDQQVRSLNDAITELASKNTFSQEDVQQMDNYISTLSELIHKRKELTEAENIWAVVANEWEEIQKKNIETIYIHAGALEALVGKINNIKVAFENVKTSAREFNEISEEFTKFSSELFSGPVGGEGGPKGPNTQGLKDFFVVPDEIMQEFRDQQWTAYQERLQMTKELKQKTEEIGLSEFELKQLLLQREVEEYRKAKVSEELIAQYSSKKLMEINKQEWQSKLTFAQQGLGQLASIFQQVAQAGGKHSKEAFNIYKGVAIAQAVVGTALAVMQALASAPPPYSFILAGISAAMGAVQIATIAASKPPSYDEGGISTTPGYYYAGVKEAHIPLKGGNIPVEMGEGAGTTIILENPVFQDLATQRATMAVIAQSIVQREAPRVIERNYYNDGSMRKIIRSPY